MDNHYLTEVRIVATLLTIPRMTCDSRKDKLIESLPDIAKKLGIAIKKEDATGLNNIEKSFLWFAINQN